MSVINEKILNGGHPWPDHIKLRAGGLIMNYEYGSLRYIYANNSEIIRMIYFAVRDKEWLTVKAEISDEITEINNDSFQIKYKSRYRSSGIDFLAEISITGSADNSLVFAFKGVALNSFEKNRIGICVLHPVDTCAGRNCIITHTNGSSEQSFFPEEISPVQVFRNVRSMKWLSDKTSCRIDYEGDIFETEDQRNWTDASFKTYSTPLSLPHPVQVEKGTVIAQRIILNVDRSPQMSGITDDLTTITLFPDQLIRLPEIGICQSGHPFPLSSDEKKQLRALRFDHYRIDILLSDPDWQMRAENGFQDASDLGWPLMFALFFDDNFREQLEDFLYWFSWRKPSVISFILFHKNAPSTPEILARELIPRIREKIPEARIGTGTNANFAEINRNRPSDTGNDFISFAVHPQEHASDNYTVSENLVAQKYIIQSAELFAGNKGICVSPVTIARRFNANISFCEMPAEGNMMPPQIDSRQMSLFGACWTTGSLKYLCESSADSITYYEIKGERGIIQGDTPPRWPDRFPSSEGWLFPVYFVFRYLLANKEMDVVKNVSSHPGRTECLSLTDGRKVRSVIVNLTGEKQIIRISCCSGLFTIRSLHSENFAEAVSDRRWTGKKYEKIIRSEESFPLEPCSVNFIEGWLRH